MSGMAATCPPITIVDFGEIRRTIRHISRTLPTFTMIEEMPTISYSFCPQFRFEASRVGKSSTVIGAEIFC